MMSGYFPRDPRTSSCAHNSCFSQKSKKQDFRSLGLVAILSLTTKLKTKKDWNHWWTYGEHFKRFGGDLKSGQILWGQKLLIYIII